MGVVGGPVVTDDDEHGGTSTLHTAREMSFESCDLLLGYTHTYWSLKACGCGHYQLLR